jgi:hypothetical protein
VRVVLEKNRLSVCISSEQLLSAVLLLRLSSGICYGELAGVSVFFLRAIVQLLIRSEFSRQNFIVIRFEGGARSTKEVPVIRDVISNSCDG